MHVCNARALIEWTEDDWRRSGVVPDRDSASSSGYLCVYIGAFFYDGRLVSRPENAGQRLNVKGALDGTGLRFVPVQHVGNQNESPEEVETVARLVDDLLWNGATCTDKKGETRDLKIEDILIVAPYNAQVSALIAVLPGEHG